MLYVHALTIPANTAEASPKTYDLELVPGVIHRVGITFPPGCAGLVHVVVEQWGHQVWPTNAGANFAADSFTIEWDDFYILEHLPLTLRLVGWNEDDTYQHTITFRFALLPREVLRPAREELGILKRLERVIFGR